MISVEALTKRFGRKVAVDQLSFDVHPGVVTGFLGPNGSGKSTTMRCMLGLDRADGGRRAVRRQTVRQPVEAAARGRCAARRRLRAPGSVRPQPPALDRRVERLAQGARRRGARHSSACRRSAASACARTRSACASGSAWPACCSASRTRSSSTSRPTASTPRASAGSATCCVHLAGQGKTVLVSSHLLSRDGADGHVARRHRPGTADRAVLGRPVRRPLRRPLGAGAQPAGRRAGRRRCAPAARRSPRRRRPPSTSAARHAPRSASWPAAHSSCCTSCRRRPGSLEDAFLKATASVQEYHSGARSPSRTDAGRRIRRRLPPPPRSGTAVPRAGRWPPMIDVLRSEWIKLRTIRMNCVLVILAVAFPLIIIGADRRAHRRRRLRRPGRARRRDRHVGHHRHAARRHRRGQRHRRVRLRHHPADVRRHAAPIDAWSWPRRVVTVVVAVVVEALVVVVCYVLSARHPQLARSGRSSLGDAPNAVGRR